MRAKGASTWNGAAGLAAAAVDTARASAAATGKAFGSAK